MACQYRSLLAALMHWWLPLTLTVAACALAAGCGSDDGPDTESARQFTGFPLYWVGESFEGLEVALIDGPWDGTERVSIIYGSCDPSGTFEASCRPPLSIQIVPLCFHLDAVAVPPPARARQIRGAPVGTQDGAPVLLTRKTQIKVYHGEGTDAGIALRALETLRSLNAVPPVISATARIPPPPPGVVEGDRPCAD